MNKHGSYSDAARRTIHMTEITVLLNLEATGTTVDDEIIWWAESPDVPGFSAAADNLPELRRLYLEALRDAVSGDFRAVEHFAAADLRTGAIEKPRALSLVGSAA
jgi:predicted RNase H-like HicB family nuclease